MNYTRILEGVAIVVLAGLIFFIGHSMWMTRENTANLFIIKMQQDFTLTQISELTGDIDELKDDVAELKDVPMKLDQILNLLSNQETRLSNVEDEVAELKGAPVE